MAEPNWTTGQDGVMRSELGRYQLSVMTVGGLPRFLVHARTADPKARRAAALVASGTRDNVAAAIHAAEALASRM